MYNMLFLRLQPKKNVSNIIDIHDFYFDLNKTYYF